MSGTPPAGQGPGEDPPDAMEEDVLQDDFQDAVEDAATQDSIQDLTPEDLLVDPTASLPDEILLMVFDGLRNDELLRARRVCRRWRDLAATRDAWRHREVRVDCCAAPANEATAASRQRSASAVAREPWSAAAVRRAPCLRKLALHGPWRDLGPSVRCAVRSLELDYVIRDDVTAAVRLLRRQAALGELRELAFDRVALRPADVAPFLAAIDACRPEKLTLGVVPTEAGETFPAAPGEDGAYLKELVFLVVRYPQRALSAGPASLLRHLLGAHAATLEAVQLADSRRRRLIAEYFYPPLRVSASLLTGCARLRRLGCGMLDDIQCLLQLPQLEAVEFTVKNGHWQPAVPFFAHATRLRYLAMRHEVSARQLHGGLTISFFALAYRLLDALGATGASALQRLLIWQPASTHASAKAKTMLPRTLNSKLSGVLRRFPHLRDVEMDATPFRYVARRGREDGDDGDVVTASCTAGELRADVRRFLLGMEAAYPLAELRFSTQSVAKAATRTLCKELAGFAHLRRLVCPVLDGMARLLPAPSLEELHLSAEQDDELTRALPFFKAAVGLRRVRLSSARDGRHHHRKRSSATPVFAEATLAALEALASSPSATSTLESLDVSVEWSPPCLPAAERRAFWTQLSAAVSRLGAAGSSLRELRLRFTQPGDPGEEHDDVVPGAGFVSAAAGAASRGGLRVVHLRLPVLRCPGLVDEPQAMEQDDDRHEDGVDDEDEVAVGARFVEELGAALPDSALCLAGLRLACDCPVNNLMDDGEDDGDAVQDEARTANLCGFWARRAPRELRDAPLDGDRRFNVCGDKASEALALRVSPGRWFRLGRHVE